MGTQPDAACADNPDMRGIKSVPRRQMRLPLKVASRWGGARKGAGRKPRGRPSMPHDTRAKIDPRYPLQLTIRAAPGLPSFRSARVFEALRGAIARASLDRFRVIHFSIPAGPWALHRRGGRGTPRPRGHAWARHPSCARREPRPRPQREGRRRSLSRPSPHDAAPDANEHGLRSAQLSKAPSRSAGCRSAKLGPLFRGLAARSHEHKRLSRHGSPDDLDGRHRLAARRRSLACRGTSRIRPTATPNLIARMFAPTARTM